MFADNPSVSGRGSDIESFRKEETKAGGIQIGAGTNDAFLRQTAQLPGDISEQIDGIGDDQQDRVGTVLYQFGDHAFQNVRVALDEIEARFTLALACASRHDAQLRSSRNCVIGAGADFHIVEEGESVLQIHQFTLQFILHDVNQGDFTCNALRSD